MAKVTKSVPETEPYFAIGLFASLRPNEPDSLDWADIDLDKRSSPVVLRVPFCLSARPRWYPATTAK